MNLRPYPEYKESGVPWLGKVPRHWEMLRMKRLFKERNVRGYPDEPLLAATQNKGVVRKEDYENRTVVAIKDLHTLKLVLVGDFVISLRSFQGGIEYARNQGIISPAYTVLYPINDAIHGYFAAFFKSRVFIDGLKLYVTGIRQGQNVDYVKLSRSPLPFPPADEKLAIAGFVRDFDRRCGQFIRNRRRLIEILNEQKQAIINQAVTRGLNPDAPLKPSGIEWLGDIPESWTTTRLGLATDIITGFPFNSRGFTDHSDDMRLLRGINISPGRIRWISVVRWPSTETDKFMDFALRAGDIVFGLDRPVIKGGMRVAKVEPTDIPCLLLQRVARLRAKPEMEQAYLLMLLQDRCFSDYLLPIFTGISVPHISPIQILGYRIALPPIEEQRDIIKKVDMKTRNILAAIDHAQREIALIREYRTRLISDVVTGKLDVRHLSVDIDKDLTESMDLDEGFDEGEVLGPEEPDFPNETDQIEEE